MNIRERFSRRDTMSILLVIALVGLLFIGCSGIDYYETHYTMNAIVIGVEDNKVLIEDDFNNIWQFIGNDYTLNDVIAVTFYTNHTDSTREDDEVIKARIIYNYDDNN